MDEFKRRNYEKEHSAGSFPRFEPLSVADAAALRAAVAVRMGNSPNEEGLKLVQEIVQEAEPVPQVSASESSFNLLALTEALGLDVPDDVFVNWRHFDDVDRLAVTDLTAHFSDIWYPASDDIEIIHPAVHWVIVVSHEGHVSYLRFDGWRSAPVDVRRKLDY